MHPAPEFPPGPSPEGAPGSDLDRPALLAALRARIARMEHGGESASTQQGVPLCAAIDRHLPHGGLARAAVHEVLAAEPGAAAGFCALMLARSGGTVLWIAAEPDAWPPGLARFGLSPADLVLVQARRPADGLWAMEECLRCPGVSGALLALPALDLTAARRLQLAAEAGGALGLLLRPDTTEMAPSATLTRWRVGALEGTGRGAHDLGDPRWNLELLRCRGGRPKDWQVVWRPAAERLDLADAEQPDFESGVDAPEQDGMEERVVQVASPRRKRAR